MLDHDDSDDFVADILEEWYSSVEKIIYDNYIQRQLVPYTVNQARDAILQIIEVSCERLIQMNLCGSRYLRSNTTFILLLSVQPVHQYICHLSFCVYEIKSQTYSVCCSGNYDLCK